MQTTRTQFIANGLVPLCPLASASTDNECSICLGDSLTDAVKTPCNHIYDRACLTEWLNGPKHNTCPLCKTILFSLPASEKISAPELRRQQVGRALRTSNLISREPPFSNFGSTEYNISSLQRAVANATHCLAQGRLPAAGEYVQLDAPGVLERVAGPCVIDAGLLSPAFIAMANLLPALAEAQDRPFSPSAVRGWRAVCNTLWLEIKTLNGKRTDALILSSLLLEKTRQAVAKSGRGQICGSFVFDEGRDFEWLDSLLDYLTLRSWQAQQEKEKRKADERETKRKRKEAGEETKMVGKCGVM